MSELTAVDMLMLPDEAMLERAGELNQELRRRVPDGFALDEKHTPHITLLQRYVHTDQLEDVYNVVEKAIRSVDVDALELRGLGIAHMEMASQPGVGLAGLVVEPSRGVIDLQGSLITAVKPFVGSGGTAAAFVTTPAEPNINDDTLHYVDNYVPDHSGSNFTAHVTVGLGRLDHLATLEAEAFDAFTFRPAGFAVFKLGNNGTAQHQLRSWTIA